MEGSADHLAPHTMMLELEPRSSVISTSTALVSRYDSSKDDIANEADMSQPKFQLETFKSWAGIDSDISYYLNSHHIDVSLT
jgi:hypothetical protein